MNTRLKVGLLFALLLILATAPAWAQTTPNPSQAALSSSSTTPDPPPAPPDPPAPCPRPPQMTYDQDGDYLRADCRSGFPDPLQYIPLGHDENYYISIGFWIRERGEYFSNPNFSDHVSGNAYLMQRYFLHADFHLGERFRFFGELASSLVNGRNGGPRAGLDEEKMYVHQGFFDLGLWKSGDDRLTLRVGREEVALGSENLVSTRDGRNIRRSLDGLHLTWIKGDWNIQLMALRPTLENADYFNDPPNHSTGFWTAYAVHPFGFLPHGNIDLYYMGLDNKSVPFDGKGTGREQRETIGTRLWGTTPRWDYTDEFTYQWGWFGSGDISAWAVSTEHGYRIEDGLWSPRFALRAVAFSGDQNPGSHDVGTFNSIFEKGPYFTYAELFARRNLVALQPSAELKLNKSVLLTFNPAFFWRESTSDGLYTVGNGIVFSGSSAKDTGRYITSQASTQIRWQMTRNFAWFTEYGHFFPGEFLKQAAPGKNLNFWTGWLDIRY